MNMAALPGRVLSYDDSDDDEEDYVAIKDARIAALEGFKAEADVANDSMASENLQHAIALYTSLSPREAARYARAADSVDDARRDRAAAAGLGADCSGAIVEITSSASEMIDGIYDLWNGGAFPAYLKRGSSRVVFDGSGAHGYSYAAQGVWLYVATDNRWWINSNRASKDARRPTGQAVNAVKVEATAEQVEAGVPPLPQRAAPGAWKTADNNGRRWVPQPNMAVEAQYRARAARLEAFAQAAWDAAGAFAPRSLAIAGAVGSDRGEAINAIFDNVPGKRDPGCPPLYQKRGDENVWLHLACDNTWYVHDAAAKDKRAPGGWAWTASPVADGTLPDEAPRVHEADEPGHGGWVVAVDGQAVPQPAITCADIDAAWDAANARGPPAVGLYGVTGDYAFAINGTYDRVPAERGPRGPPVYRRRGKAAGTDVWLFLASSGQWLVADTDTKDANAGGVRGTGWAVTAATVGEGVLPHEAPQGWIVAGAGGAAGKVQPSVRASAVPNTGPAAPDLGLLPADAAERLVPGPTTAQGVVVGGGGGASPSKRDRVRAERVRGARRRAAIEARIEEIKSVNPYGWRLGYDNAASRGKLWDLGDGGAFLGELDRAVGGVGGPVRGRAAGGGGGRRPLAAPRKAAPSSMSSVGSPGRRK